MTFWSVPAAPTIAVEHHPDPDPLDRRLIEVVTDDRRFCAWLQAVRSLNLRDWCIGAGAVRDLVWNALHGKASRSQPHNVDVAFFDAFDSSIARDESLRERLETMEPTVPWDVTNQASVQLWFEQAFGHAVEPLHSLDEAVASRPEFATAAGVTMEPDGTIRLLAPHGLADLFAMVVRRNPARISVETYRLRVAVKRYAERWPQVRVLPCV